MDRCKEDDWEDSEVTNQGAGHCGVEEEFVETHVRFLGPYAAHQFNCLLGREGIHLSRLLNETSGCEANLLGWQL
jgi:hypothetical protein